jgi:hypothetical protein
MPAAPRITLECHAPPPPSAAAHLSFVRPVAVVQRRRQLLRQLLHLPVELSDALVGSIHAGLHHLQPLLQLSEGRPVLLLHLPQPLLSAAQRLLRRIPLAVPRRDVGLEAYSTAGDARCVDAWCAVCGVQGMVFVGVYRPSSRCMHHMRFTLQLQPSHLCSSYVQTSHIAPSHSSISTQ